MPRPRSEDDARLTVLYERVPSIPGCKGHCWISCGPVDMSWRERQRLHQAGVKLADPIAARADPGTHWCEALSGDGRCTVYPIRPLLCRLWGTVRSMACPHGCVPDRWLTEDEAAELVREALDYAGPVSLSSMADQIRLAMFGTQIPDELAARRASARK